MSGVYQIYNTETNKRYIGSSIDVQRRLKEHLRNLKANRHCNQHLQNAWNGYQIPRFTDMPEDKKEQWRKHLSEGTIKRYSDFNNRPEGIYLKCIFSNDIKYYPSLREASRTLGIDKGGIKYVIQHKEGYMKKLNCTFVLIDKIEFLANKVVGER